MSSYVYRPPDTLDPLESELEANAGDIEWFEGFVAKMKGPNGEVSPEVCKKVNRAWSNVIEKIFHGQIQPVTSELNAVNKKLVDLIDDLGKNHKHLERRVNGHSSDIEMLRSAMANYSLTSDQVLEMSKMTNSHVKTLSESLTSVSDMVSVLVESKLKTSKTKTIKMPFYAWALIGAGAVGAVVFLVTGDDSLLNALRGSK